VADDLLSRGYGVRTIERSGARTPDLLVSGYGIEVAVEVYSPRELRAVDAWVDDVKDLLKNVDMTGDYFFRVGSEIERMIPPSPEQFDPWLADKILGQTADQVFEEIREDAPPASGPATAALTSLVSQPHG
jgi:hypothetical protein